MQQLQFLVGRGRGWFAWRGGLGVGGVGGGVRAADVDAEFVYVNLMITFRCGMVYLDYEVPSTWLTRERAI